VWSIARGSRSGPRRSRWRRSAHCMSCWSLANRGWSPRTATPSRRRLMMGSLVPLARRTQLVPRPEGTPPTAPRQLDLVLDDVRLRGMTPPERQAGALCAGQVGAVLCLDASRLARNGRDWHHLLELCGLVEARVIDLDGVYDPCLPNDRLLLGMKGSISEFELGIIRSRMYEAARSKARRGELRISSPIGYAWDRNVGLGADPDRRVAGGV